ncbi:Cys/Met metabolism PLP-dependent enzyme-domain-containing protein [Entophlyctis helioformis]|nr:Cys/Met metabolism PLP-dependent enzyme-domain-containing protein [Entophlyctis helioformis]
MTLAPPSDSLPDLATLAIHADKPHSTDVSAPLHVSTTFRYDRSFNERVAVSRGWLPASADLDGSTPHIYSRITSEVRDRLESVLGALEKDAFAVTYGSGLAAIHAAFTCYQPKHILISREGYHGTHGVVELQTRGRNVKVSFLEDDSDGSILRSLEAGDLVWLESPQNPRGEVADLQYYLANRREGVIIGVDSTFAPPPIQLSLTHGADMAMHSCTKFLGGHSDLLGGLLMVKDAAVHKRLLNDRIYMGNVLGNMEAWLLLRSMRTFKLRVMRQSDTAARLAHWLNSRITGSSDEEPLKVVERVWHASLPSNPGHEAAKRQGEGWSGVLSVEFVSLHHARLICNNLAYFDNATSLGGCESLIEWRSVSDPKISPKLCRISIGLEDFEDLRNDFRRGFLAVDRLVKDQKLA